MCCIARRCEAPTSEMKEKRPHQWCNTCSTSEQVLLCKARLHAPGHANASRGGLEVLLKVRLSLSSSQAVLEPRTKELHKSGSETLPW